MRAPSFLLTLSQRSRRSWTSWRLKRTFKQATRTALRLQLLRQEMDHQLLRLKELEQLEGSLQHRQRELLESQQYRLSQRQASKQLE